MIPENEDNTYSGMISRLLNLGTFTEEIRKSAQINERPVIGIVTQPWNKTNDYIMADYIKFAQSAGARVVPIVWRDSDEEIEALVAKLNGILMPGGGTLLKNEDGSLTEYTQKGEVILNKVKELNDQGIYYPIWAVCMSFQEISQIEAPFADTLSMYKFESDDISNNITLKPTIADSVLFNAMPQHLITALQNENITYNHHHDGIFPEIYQKYPALRDNYLVLGNSYDENDLEYIAFVEHKNYPIWGIQFHPEKVIYIWKPDLHVPHDPTSIEFTQFLANFFVGESRKNFNSFESEDEVFKNMIENVALELTTTTAQDIYVFPN